MIRKKRKLIYILIFVMTCQSMVSQDSIFFNNNWEKTTKDLATYYRLKPIKFKAEELLGEKISNIDSLYLIEDYYMCNNNLQFRGYSVDEEANELIGKSIWFYPNGNPIESNIYGATENPKFRLNRFYYTPIAVNVGYHYIGSGINSGYIGLDYRMSDTNKPAINLGVGAYITELDNKLTAIPALQGNYTFATILLGEMSASTKNIKWGLGINLFNYVQLKSGYSFWYNDSSRNAYTFGLNICLGNTFFYDDIRLGW